MAPQYPEGLYLQIHADRFSGDTEKINGLSHYIGMATIHDDMFPEFTYLPKVIVALGRHAGMLLSRREDMTLRAMRSTSRLSYDAGAPKDDPSARIKIPLVVTYHPAYVLRQEGDGRRVPDGRASPTELVMKDLERALAIVRGTGG